MQTFSTRSERLSASLGEEKETTSNTNKKKETEVSQRLTNFVLSMYHQLISEQRSQIFALLQKKTARKEIADIVGISQSTLSREIKRNSTPSGKYIWTKAHDMAMQRRKNTVTNAKLSDELVWRIKEYYYCPLNFCLFSQIWADTFFIVSAHLITFAFATKHK